MISTGHLMKSLAFATCVTSIACGSSTTGNDASSNGGDSATQDQGATAATVDAPIDSPPQPDASPPQPDAPTDAATDEAAGDLIASDLYWDRSPEAGPESTGDAGPDLINDAGLDVITDAGPEATVEVGSDAAHATCPTPPALTEIPPIAPAGTDSVIDLGNAGSAVISAPGASGGDFASYNTSGRAYTGGLGFPIFTILGQTPNGAAAVGGDSNSRAIICSGTCSELGTLAHQRFAPSIAADANDTALVVGSATLDDVTVTHPFSWTLGGGMVDLGTFGGSMGHAVAVSAVGRITGDAAQTTGQTHAFLWDGTMQDLGTLGGAFSAGMAINASGDVVGVAKTAAGNDHAFLWHGGAMHDLGTLGGMTSTAVAINAGGQVVGVSLTAANQQHAFFWSAGVMQDIGTLGGTGSRVDGRRPLNDAGQVVGTSQNAAGKDHAFIWQLGAIRDLGTLGGATSAAVSINSSGRVVGNSVNASASARAFFVDPGACTTP